MCYVAISRPLSYLRLLWPQLRPVQGQPELVLRSLCCYKQSDKKPSWKKKVAKLSQEAILVHFLKTLIDSKSSKSEDLQRSFMNVCFALSNFELLSFGISLIF